ncbi:hypothetical protein SAY87_016107 [Trapa incisa]|uniref:Glycoside hydrolase family 5 domain-containing protein n=1 Tax=Trapa incisa TaxID=236973 RepID=A0AAN7QX72_9MYRT|nr:hypothetical protein SAY87_016107 [Trapa incisa]
MKLLVSHFFPAFFLLFLAIQFQCSKALVLPLSTSSRWIVDGDGQRVKLACVNWAAHLEPSVAEGLSKQPVDSISKWISSAGFNCVRFTWPLFLITDGSLGSKTVEQSFRELGLYESIAGIHENNPPFLNLSLLDAFQAVVASLARNGLWVILDNHISKPGWCCDDNDGNGFFGDRYFDLGLWVKGLKRMATMFRGVPNVIAMSLRNELRGRRQSAQNWFRYMQEGAEAVHAANPDLLVIVSGLHHDRNFDFLIDQPLNLTFSRNLVFELHWYSSSTGGRRIWSNRNANEVCRSMADEIMSRAGFLLEMGNPLFVSEFGGDQSGNSVDDNRYLNCFIGLAAELDMDWAIWTVVGSYYLRQGMVGASEPYGLLNTNFSDIRNREFLQRISSLQTAFQDSSDDNGHKLIFHPQTGLCVQRKANMGPLQLGLCADSDVWIYTPRKTLVIEGTYFCLQATGIDEPAKLGIICTDSNSRWDAISASEMHLSSKVGDQTVCMDVDSSKTIITDKCKCLSGDSSCDPASQWFRLITKSSPSMKKTRL